MTTQTKLLVITLCLVLLAPMSCRPKPPRQLPEMGLDDATLARHASVGPFQPRAARVIVDNDASFAHKLRLVEGARSSIDIMYFVYHEDRSSSVLAKALLAAANRGVEVRMLLDYSTNYKHLDFLTMLEKQAAAGPGSLRVRFYNRPTRRIIEDAAYMTIGCSEVLEEAGDEGEGRCDERKFEVIEKAFAEEDVAGEGKISNLNIAHSGLFMSGLYGGHQELMALAVTEGQNLDLEALRGSAEGSGERLEGAKKLARLYWRSRRGPLLGRVASKVKLGLAYLHYGSEIRELRDTITSFLPVGRLEERGGWQDWEFWTDYLHQKFLLVDGEKLLNGGRNIGDSYHLGPHPLLEGIAYFEDTEIAMELDEDRGLKLRKVYDRLWDFRQMVATSAEVRQHAPNDFITNQDALDDAEAACADMLEEQRESCVDREFSAGALDLEQREAAKHEEMLQFAAEYGTDYSPAEEEGKTTSFEVDAGARAYYFENVPYNKELTADERQRLFGAQGLEEHATGKYLHLAWRRGMTNACLSSSAEEPKRVLLLNPYYLPPATLLGAAGWMVDGTLDCRHVTVQVLTNSLATNDFKLIVPLAYVGLKAFSEFYHGQGDPEKRAQFDFYEYQARPDIPNFALHSKVSILGDDIIIGSANIDARSYLMDSNNGILLRDAPNLLASFTELLDTQLADPELVARIDESLRASSLEDIRSQQQQVLTEFLATRGIGEGLSAEQQAMLDGLLGTLLDRAYELTHAVLRGDEGAIDDYNRLLKYL